MAPNTLDPVTKKSESFQQDESSLKSRFVGNNKQEVEKSSSQQALDNKDVDISQDKTVFKASIRWPDLIAQLFVHVGALYGLYYLITLQAKLFTYFWCKFFQLLSYTKQENQFLFNFFSLRVGLNVRYRNHSR